jgi:hypothetical protein
MLVLLKKIAFYTLPLLILGILTFGTQSFMAPVPTEQYQQCLNEAQKDRTKNTECKTHETIWQRTISDPVAYYTFWLTLFTAALAGVGLIQWNLIAKQIRLASDEFNATHRPKLRVRFFPELPVPADEQLVVTYEVVNIGDAMATIVQHELSVYGIALWDTDAPDFAAVIPINKHQLISGEISPRYRIPITLENITGTAQIPVTPTQLTTPRVRGRFFYVDAKNQTRVTQFARTYDWETHSFRIIKDTDSDYAYED